MKCIILEGNKSLNLQTTYTRTGTCRYICRGFRRSSKQIHIRICRYWYHENACGGANIPENAFYHLSYVSIDSLYSHYKLMALYIRALFGFLKHIIRKMYIIHTHIRIA